MQMKFSDEHLIKGCRKQNRKMQQLLYDKYSGSMYAVALRYARSQLEAEDITQEAFVKVFKSIDSFRSDSSLGYWIKKIVVNTALNHQRSKLYLYPMVDVTEMQNWSEQDLVLSNFSYNELLDMIQQLPDGCRVIFNMYAIEGYKHHEIAEMLNVSEGTSKSQYSRAKLLLQKKIQDANKINYGTAGEING
jgi:RNA polymerase sigma-70 factor (ECF subfamily)